MDNLETLPDPNSGTFEYSLEIDIWILKKVKASAFYIIISGDFYFF